MANERKKTMKLIHVADLHFGKGMHGFSLLEDQKYWIDEFVKLVDAEKPDVVLVSGDVYDRSSPGDEAVTVADDFFTRLAERNIKVMAVSGNHDSGYKLSFLNKLTEKSGLFIGGKLENKLKRVALEDEFGKVNFWLLPYCFPAEFDEIDGFEERPRTYDEAVRKYLSLQDIDYSERNVLVAHQTVTDNKDDDEVTVGNVGNIGADAFYDFDYVALGHVHAPLVIGKKYIRYAGSPLCFKFDELKFPHKGAVVINLGKKGDEVDIKRVDIEPLHPLVEIKGTLSELISAKTSGILELVRDGKTVKTDLHGKYIHVILTDDRISPEAYAVLTDMAEAHNSRIMIFSHEPVRAVRENGETEDTVKSEEKSVSEYFKDFLEFRNKQSASDEDDKIIDFVAELIENSDVADLKNNLDSDADKLVKMLLGEENA